MGNSLLRFTLVAVCPTLAPKSEDPQYTVTVQQSIWVNPWGVNTVRAYDQIGTPATRIRMDDNHVFEVAEDSEFVAHCINTELERVT